MPIGRVLSDAQKKMHYEAHKRYKQRHPQKVKDAQRRWRQNNPEKTRKNSRDSYWRNRDRRLLQQKNYAKSNPKVVRCHWKAARTTVLMTSSCELCPDEDRRIENLEKHHPDHDYPDVFVTVCPSCHRFAEEDITDAGM